MSGRFGLLGATSGQRRRPDGRISRSQDGGAVLTAGFQDAKINVSVEVNVSVLRVWPFLGLRTAAPS